jgi:tetratricopeptide (TPR) repeat protein
LAGSARLDELGPISLNLLADALETAGDRKAAETILRAAQRRHPGDYWLNASLAGLLGQDGRRQEALRFRYAARAARPKEGLALVVQLELNGEAGEALEVLRELAQVQPEDHLIFLGYALKIRGQRAEADTVLEQAVAPARASVKERPDDGTAYLELGRALLYQVNSNDGEIEAAFREAVRLRPDLSSTHAMLAWALMSKDPPEAEAQIREVMRIAPGSKNGRWILGQTLGAQGRYAEAEADARDMIRLEPPARWPYFNLGESLLAQGKPAEAEAAFREEGRLDPDHPGSGLGRALERQGRYAEAEAAYRETIRSNKSASLFTYGAMGADCLANMLMSRGRFEEALAVLRQTSTLFVSSAYIRKFETALRRAERRVAMAPRLPAVLAGADRPADAREGLELAGLCLDSGRPAAAARLFADALAADPALADDRKSASPGEHPAREDAARAAAQAGCGAGRDDPPDAAARTKLRRQALEWMRAELAAWAKEVDAGHSALRSDTQAALTRWRSGELDLAGVHSPDGLARWPEAERADWRAFWADVDALQKRLWAAPR